MDAYVADFTAGTEGNVPFGTLDSLGEGKHMSRVDKIPPPVRDGIQIALFVAAISATAAFLLHEPLFILFGGALFLFAWFRKIGPSVQQYYQQEGGQLAEFDEDATYQPILDRYEETGNESALFESYAEWKTGPYCNETRLRFLQTAILLLIDKGDIYRIEELMSETEELAAQEGLTDRFEAFRAECDRNIAELAQHRLGIETDQES